MKIARDGIEARNDALAEETVRATASVSEGAWYYEVTLFTNGMLQIGWATKESVFDSEVFALSHLLFVCMFVRLL